MRRLVAALIGSTAALTGCGDHGDRQAAAIARDLTRELGVAVAVRCQRDACTATTAAGLRIPIVRHGARWETAELLDPRPIEAEVAARLADLGASQPVDCGPLRLATDDRIDCALGGGGAAFVQIADDGALTVELALSAAQAAVRRTELPPGQLDEASTALDTDDAEGTEGTDDDPALDGVDAGTSPVVRGPGG